MVTDKLIRILFDKPDSLLKENILNKKVSFIAEITNYFYSAMKKVLG